MSRSVLKYMKDLNSYFFEENIQMANKVTMSESGVVTNTCIPNTQRAEAKGSLKTYLSYIA